MNTRQKAEERAKQFRQLMKWLAPPDPLYDFDKARKLRRGSTGTWLLEDRMFQSWKEKANSFLWINGKVGSGKTILSSTVIAELRSQESHSPRVLFYFFTFSDVAKQSLESAIKSLIFQAYVQIAQTREPLDLLYRRQMDGAQAATLERLCETFSNMIQLAGEVWIVLDALDESTTLDDHQGQGILPWIKKLHEASLNTHVLVTSRPEPNIRASFSELDPEGHTIYLDDSRVSSDIDDYIDSTINDPGSFRKWDHGPNTSSTSVKACMKDELKKKAGGMFRWVSCQFETLSICSDHEEVRRTLEDLPGNLHDTYSRILKRIDDQSRLRPRFKSKAIRLLQFLIFSERPLLIEEAVDVLATEVGTSGGFNPDDRMKDQEQILEYCSGLVVKVPQVDPSLWLSEDIRTDHFMLQLAHVSVKEYLTSQQMDNQFLQNFTPGVSQNSIAETCLSYLLAYNHKRSLEIGQHSVSFMERSFPFAEYCRSHWANHQAKAEMESDDVPSCILAANFLSGQTLFELSQSDFWWKLDITARALLFASEKGLFHTIGELLRRPYFSDPAALRFLSDDALCKAADHGHTKTVSVLLQKVNEMNAPAINLNDSLVKASKRNHWGVTSTLIAYSAGDTRISNALANALVAVSGDGYVEFAQRLLQHGAKPTERALTAASSSGHIQIVQLLLKHGANVPSEAITAASRSALTAASGRGDIDIMRLLLEHGADIQSEALIAASGRGDIDIMRLVLEHGADVQSEALAAASGFGDIDIVRFLFDYGMAQNSIGLFGNALQAAMNSDRLCVVRLLLEKGAIMEKQSTYESNVLEIACARGHDDIVEMLLEREPRPNESNISYYINNVYSTRNGAAETKRQFVKACQISRPLDRGEYYRRALRAALSSGHQKSFALIMDRIIDEPKGGELYTDTLRATVRNGPEDVLGKLMEQLLANQRLYDFVLRDARSNKWENVVRELHSAHDREEGRDNDMAGGRVYA
ncbi:hypothetical protein PFICI_01740 [Pestalotiopsis fici W106-1]|uniref:NACHT domain-containing protein n=1 Tax=Pestalotiopsis fici (strain W106-1 / CGMCC3.15140) TaxID=1229662 RepID=W3XQX0_PESFW|nr:uncharacterized protein PFICI_01740 [Pestalotiopsis fici W106-1]ETS87912.1 hypothetical protein PFICI_01740 [Pestalotiopsis fici W106-1]